MAAPSRSLDPRSGLVLDTHELGRRPGALQEVRRPVPAPNDLGIAVIGVPAGSPVDLDLRLESVVEGVLVSGTATVRLRGECVRCLGEVAEQRAVDLTELFVYPGSEATDEEASRLAGDLLDLEPVLRDEVVLELPFQPLCRSDCPGLCPDCGANLNDDPTHRHEVAPDPRWARLRDLETRQR